METLDIYNSINNFFNSINFKLENNHLDFENETIYIKEKNKNNFTSLKLFSYTNKNIYYKIIGDNLKEINNIKKSLIKKIDEVKFLKSKIEDTYIIHCFLGCEKNCNTANLVFRFHKRSAETPYLTFIDQKLNSFQFTAIYKNGNFEYFTNNNQQNLYKNFESMLLNTFKTEIINQHPDLSFEDSKEFLQIMQLINY